MNTSLTQSSPLRDGALFERLAREVEQGDEGAGELLVTECLRRQSLPARAGHKIWVPFLTELQRCVVEGQFERGSQLTRLLALSDNELVLRWASGGARTFRLFAVGVAILRKLFPTEGHQLLILSREIGRRRKRWRTVRWTDEFYSELADYHGLPFSEEVEAEIRARLNSSIAEQVARVQPMQFQDNGDGSVSGRLRVNWEPETAEDLRYTHGMVGQTERGPVVEGQVVANEVDLMALGSNPNTDEERFEGEAQLVEEFANHMDREIDAEILRGLTAFHDGSIEALEARWAPLLENVSEPNQRLMMAQLFERQSRHFQTEHFSNVTLPAVLGQRYPAVGGRQGSQYLEAGYVYAPYVPMQITPTVLNGDLAHARLLVAILDAGGKKTYYHNKEVTPSEEDALLGFYKLDVQAGIVEIGPHPPVPILPSCNLCLDRGSCVHCAGRGWEYSGEAVSAPCEACEETGQVTCEECNGTGFVGDRNGREVECFECNGEGVFSCYDCEGRGFYEEPLRIDCPRCDGTGRCGCCK